MDVAHNTLLHLVPDHMLGRVFGNLYATIAVAAIIAVARTPPPHSAHAGSRHCPCRRQGTGRCRLRPVCA